MKTKLKRWLPSLMIIASVFNSFGQDDSTPNVTPPTPDAGQLTKHVDFPMNLYTGTPSINLPLYTIKTNGIKVPISLSYHASGLKVDALPTWVGMNWSLNYGGVINRTIHGKPDEWAMGYYKKNIFSDTEGLPMEDNVCEFMESSFPNAWGVTEDDDIFNDLINGDADGQPDIFSFSFNGYSGKFFFDETGKIVIHSEQEIKIENPHIIHQNQKDYIVGWTVWTPNGTRYVFGCEREEGIRNDDGLEYSDYSNNAEPKTTAWYIKKIVPPNGVNHVNYSFVQKGLGEYQHLQPAMAKKTNNYSVPNDEPTPHGKYTSEEKKVYLKSISTNDLSISFTHDTIGDGKAYLVKLNSIKIDIKNRSEYLLFDFDYFDHKLISSDFSLSPNRKFSLKSITKSGPNINSTRLYLFDYDDQDLPSRGSFAQDHWGYYNGQDDNEWLVPTVNIDSYSKDDIGEIIPSLLPVWEGGYDQYFTPFEHLMTSTFYFDAWDKGRTTIKNANRNSNESAMQAGILERIHYPEGGYTQFDFEAHDFSFVSRKKEVLPDYHYSLNYLTSTPIISNGEMIKLVFHSNNITSSDCSLVVYRNPIEIEKSDVEVYRFNLDLYNGPNQLRNFQFWLNPGKYRVKIEGIDQTERYHICLFKRPLTGDFAQTDHVFHDKGNSTSISAGGMEVIQNKRQFDTLTIPSGIKQFVDINIRFESETCPDNLSNGHNTSIVGIRGQDMNRSWKFDEYEDCSTFNNPPCYNHSETIDNFELHPGEYIIYSDTRDLGGKAVIEVTYKNVTQRNYMAKGGGLRVKKITNNDGKGNKLEREYKYLKHEDDLTYKIADDNTFGQRNISSGVLTSFPDYVFCDFEDWCFFKSEAESMPQVSISSNGQIPTFTSKGNSIEYQEVEVLTTVEGSSPSKKIQFFSTAVDYPDLLLNFANSDISTSPGNISYDWKKGQPTKSVYINDKSKVVKEELYTYNDIANIFNTSTPPEGDNSNLKLVPAIKTLPKNNNAGVFHNYFLLSDVSLLKEKTTKHFFGSDKNLVQKQTFDHRNKKQIMTETETSDRGKHSTEHAYLKDVLDGMAAGHGGGIYQQMKKRNMVNYPIETIIKRNGKIISGELNIYGLHNDIVVLKEKYVFESSKPIDNAEFTPYRESTDFAIDNHYRLAQKYEYNDVGRIIKVEQISNGIPFVSGYLWDSDNQNPICQYTNAEEEEIAYTSFEEIQNTTPLVSDGWSFTSNVISSNSYSGEKCLSISNSGSLSTKNIIPEGSYLITFAAKQTTNSPAQLLVDGQTISVEGDWKTYTVNLEITSPRKVIIKYENSSRALIDELRLHPADAQMTSYSYTPFYGINSRTDVDGTTQNYFYDTFGRLKYIKDHRGNIIKKYEYNYKQD